MARPILVTGAAGRVGAVGRTVSELLLRQGHAVRAMVRKGDERAQALRDMGAEVVVGDLLDLASMHQVIAGCETMYFDLSVSHTFLVAMVNAAAVAKHLGIQKSATRASILCITSSRQTWEDTHSYPNQRKPACLQTIAAALRRLLPMSNWFRCPWPIGRHALCMLPPS
jgi:NAD(P)-dependent dehydrogenase (short-subunit alcohol dehydrogenase family)